LGVHRLNKSSLKTQPDRTHTHGLGRNFCPKPNPTYGHPSDNIDYLLIRHFIFKSHYLRLIQLDITSIITKKITLIKSIDWDSWIVFVRVKTYTSNIWELINSNQAKRLIHLTESKKSIFISFSNFAQLNVTAYDLYKQRIAIFKLIRAKYEKQQRVFEKIIFFIHEIITTQNIKYLEKTKSHSWNLLRVLKARLALTSNARLLKMKQQYHKLCKRLTNKNINIWLNEWTFIYIDVKIISLTKITSRRLVWNFWWLYFISIQTYISLTLQIIKNSNMYDLIEKLQDYLSLYKQKKRNQNKNSHLVFSTEKMKNQSFESTFND
jgi:hypothetical protein